MKNMRDKFQICINWLTSCKLHHKIKMTAAIIEEKLPDAILVLQSEGVQIDITGLVNYVNSNRALFEIRELPTARLVALRMCEVRNDVLPNIDNRRLDQPILVAFINGSEWIIDGNHRLKKRKQLDKKTTKYIQISDDVLCHFMSNFSWR